MAIITADYNKTKYSGLQVHKDGITFLFNIYVEGKRYRKTYKSNPSHTKADRLKKAYIELENFRAMKVHENTITANMDATVLDYWIKLKSVKGWSAKHEQTYNYFFDNYLTSLGKMKIREVKPAHFTDLNSKLTHLANRTKNRAYEILNPIFDLAIEDEIIVRSPIKKAHIPVRKQDEEKKVITDAETKYRKIYNAINKLFGSTDKIVLSNGDTIQCNDNPHHLAIFLFGFYGRRVQEVLSLEWEDIDLDNNGYIVRAEHSKVNQDMTFTLPNEIKVALTRLKTVNSVGKVFKVANVEWQYQYIRAISGINEFTFHWMRNLVVSALSSKGVDTTHLSAMLGHTDSATLKKYLSLQRDTSTLVTNTAAKQLLEEFIDVEVSTPSKIPS